MSNSRVEALKAQGSNKKSFKKDPDQKFSNSELLKKFFSPFVPKGQTEAIFKFRIIPKATEDEFEEVKFHYMKVGKKWEKFLCLEEHDHDCPLCEAFQGLKARGESKEEYNKYRSSVFYIVKGIDRAKEHEGPKFWRFKKNFKGKGEFDKIVSCINIYGDVIDANEGYDLTIECALDDRGNSYVRNIACVKSTPLSSDKQQAEQWINDTTTWKDVFRPKTEEHLQLVVEGRAPYWDENLKKFITPGQENIVPDENVNSGELKDNPLMKDEKLDEDSLLDDEDDSDLPF